MNTSIALLLDGKGRALHAVPVNVSVFEAVQKMNQHRIGAVLVMNGESLAGIFTERDVLIRVIAASLDPRAIPVSQVMTANVITVEPEATVQEVMEIFAAKHCRHLPVVRDGRLLGLVSIGDVSRWLANAHRAEAESLRQYVAGALTA
jgi:CBS domain-containing protein